MHEPTSGSGNHKTVLHRQEPSATRQVLYCLLRRYLARLPAIECRDNLSRSDQPSYSL
jgi:hypothetical protein